MPAQKKARKGFLPRLESTDPPKFLHITSSSSYGPVALATTVVEDEKFSDDNAKTKLRESQRAWIQFRDKEIALIQAFYSKIDGTMFRVISASTIMELTHKRAISLSYMVEFIELREDTEN